MSLSLVSFTLSRVLYVNAFVLTGIMGVTCLSTYIADSIVLFYSGSSFSLSQIPQNIRIINPRSLSMKHLLHKPNIKVLVLM